MGRMIGARAGAEPAGGVELQAGAAPGRRGLLAGVSALALLIGAAATLAPGPASARCDSNAPASGTTVTCLPFSPDPDPNGVIAPASEDVTVILQINGSVRPGIERSGDGAHGIHLGSGARVEISGEVKTRGADAAAIWVGPDSEVVLGYRGYVTTLGANGAGVRMSSGTLEVGELARVTAGNGPDSPAAIAVEGGGIAEDALLSITVAGGINAYGSGRAVVLDSWSQLAIVEGGTVITNGAGQAAVTLTGAQNEVSLSGEGAVLVGGAGSYGVHVVGMNNAVTLAEPDATIAVEGAGGRGISIDGLFNVLTVNGRIQTIANDAIGIHVGSTGNFITVGADGDVWGQRPGGHGIRIAEGHNTLRIDGAVHASGDNAAGLLVSGAANEIYLSGAAAVRSQDGEGAALDLNGASSTLVLMEDGQIYSRGQNGLRFRDGDNNRLVMTGGSIQTIYGSYWKGDEPIAAIRLEEADESLVAVLGGSVVAGSASAIRGDAGSHTTTVILGGELLAPGGNAILLEGGSGTNRVELLPGYLVTAGKVVAAGADLLAFTGEEGEASFDLSQLDPGYGGLTPFSGFERLEKAGESLWTLSGDAGSFAPATIIDEGRLNVTGRLGGTLRVDRGGILGGNGFVGGVTVANGGIVAPGTSVGTLTMTGLALVDESVLEFELGAPGIVGGTASDLIVVNGRAILDGMVNVTALSGFGNGLYTLMQYQTVVDNGIGLGATPSGYSFDLDISTSALTLLVGGGAAGGNQFWDGANTAPGNVANGRGGTGNWSTGGANWTNAAGSANAGWGGEFAIFGGTAGTVSVMGEIPFTGMQFLSDGYQLSDGALGARLVAPEAGATITLGAGIGARIGTTFTGGPITKEGAGTLTVGGEIVRSYGPAETWVVTDGELRIDGSFRAASWADDTAVIVKNGATLSVEQFGSIGAGSTGNLELIAVEIDGQGHVVVEEGGFVGGRIWGIASESTVRIGADLGETGLGLFSYAIGLSGDGNEVEVNESGVTQSLRLSGDDTVVIIDGRVTGNLYGGVWLSGNGGNISVDGSIDTHGDTFAQGSFRDEGIRAVGDNHNIDVAGSVSTVGDGSTAIRASGDNNRITVSGDVSTSGIATTQARGVLTPFAIVMSGDGNVLDVSGAVSTGGADVPTVLLAGDSSTMTLSGTVAAASDTETPILFENGSPSSRSSLELQPGYAITGLVLGAGDSAGTELIFGGSGSGSFDVAAIGDAAQFRDFDRFAKTGTSTWTLTGANDGLNPVRRWEVEAGTLLVDASLRETLFGVSSGATLGGTGTVRGVAVNDGTLAPGGVGSIGTLTATSTLVLDPSSIVHFDLGAPGTIGGTQNDLIVVEGDLTLDGARIDIADAGGFGNGEYTLIQYDRLFLLYGASLGDTPDPDLAYNLDTGTGTNSAVMLTVSGGAAGDTQYWDGGNTAIGVEGGSGVWNAVNDNWANQDGTVNEPWAGQFAIFKGAAGTVLVQDAQSFTGMQILTSGYRFDAGTDAALTPGLDATGISLGEGITATIAAPLTGSGGIVKSQAGTLVLAGANTHAGATAVSGGILRAGAADAFSAASAHRVAAGAVLDLAGYDQTIGSLAGDGNVTLGAATLTAGNTTDTTFGGVISGDGGLVKTGTGRMTLTGDNTYTGLTTVSQGGLWLGNDGTAGSVAGDIQNDDHLFFERADDFTYAGTLSGTGQTEFLGTGMAVLTGDSSGLAGRVLVLDEQHLRIAAGAVLGATLVNIDNDDTAVGGTLSGLGTVAGNVLLERGTLAPGAETLGTLTVDGNVAFESGSTFAVRIAADGTNDALAAASADLGGTVTVTALDAHTSYVEGQSYTILTTAGPEGVSGRFDGATMLTHSAFLTPQLGYGGSEVTLTLGVTRDFAAVAGTANQAAAAAGLNELEQTGEALMVFNAIAGMSEAEAQRAFDQSSGEIHAAGQQVADQGAGLFGRTLRYMGPAALGAGQAGAQVIAAGDATLATRGAAAGARGAWVAPLGAAGHVEGDGNAARLDWRSAGLAGGYEAALESASGEAVGGFGLGYLRSHGSVDARQSDYDSDGFYLGAYAAWAEGPWALSGALSYGAARVSTKRSIGFADSRAEARYWTRSLLLSAEASHAFALSGGARIAPLVTLDAGWSGHDGFSESGAGPLDLSAEAESWNRLDAGLGLALSQTLATDRGRLTLEGRAVWEHAFADVVPAQALSLAGSPAGFTVLGPDAGRDRLRIGAGMAWEVSQDMTLRARYDGLFSDQQSNHSASLAFNFRF